MKQRRKIKQPHVRQECQKQAWMKKKKFNQMHRKEHNQFFFLGFLGQAYETWPTSKQIRIRK